MKLNPFLILCFTGLLPVSVSVLKTVPHHYDLIMTPATWKDAQAYCRLMYTDLATVLSDTDWLRVKKVSTSKGLITPAWSGLYNDIYNWRWAINNVPLTDTIYANWYPGQPDNYWRFEACTIIAGNNQWYDINCYILRPFICYDARFIGAERFVPISSAMTWPDAQVYCRTYHSDLAIVLNSKDDDICVQLKLSQGDSWIGLHRTMDIWKWSDGTVASNVPWSPGEPYSLYGSKDCAVLQNGYISGEVCTSQLNFFCGNISPKRSQTVRLQVMSYGSVFDPAVMQSSIFEQIKQKLAKNGMLKNTTMTWKVQSDGNIFRKKEKHDLSLNCN